IGRPRLWGCRRSSLRIEPTGADRLGHVLRLLAVDRAVVELDPRVLLLAGSGFRHRAVERPRLRHCFVPDALLVERLLHPPAGMTVELHPHVPAAVEFDRHHFPPLGRMSVTPSRTVNKTETTRSSVRTRSLKRWIACAASESGASSRTRPLLSVLSAAMKPRSPRRGRTAS